MPVEIRELIIKVSIEDKQKKAPLELKDLQELKNKVVRECTEKVMAQLANASER